MTICPHCNEKNLVNSKFCQNCGRPLSDDIPSYLYPEDDDLWEKVKEFGKDIKKKISEKNYKEIISDKSNPVTNMLITFVAWIILRMIGILPFVIIVRILAFLMHPVGLVFSLAVTYVYSIHREEIMKRVKEIKEMDHVATLRELIDTYYKPGEEDEEEEEEEKEKKEKEEEEKKED